MSKPLTDLIRIKNIQNNIIYTKDKTQYVMLQLESMQHENIDIAFTTFVESIAFPFTCILYKRKSDFHTFEPYFTRQLKENLATEYLKSLLLYIKSFKERIAQCSSYSIVFCICIQKESDVPVCIHTAKYAGFSVKQLEDEEIHFFFNKLFS